MSRPLGTPPHPGIAYRPDIDGLRAVAILSVVLYHAGVPLLSGGYAGVDIFFVISGFLITRIIRAELNAGRFSLSSFYERRARRILPALFAMLGVSFVFAWLLLLPGEWEDFAGSAIAAALFGSNIWFEHMLGSYFGPSAELTPLLHVWSLAVEEQFYIVAPVLLLFLWRVAPGATRPFVLAAIFVSFTLAAIALTTEPPSAFYWMPYRAWELGFGVFLALGGLPAFNAQRHSEIASVMALLLIGIALLAYDDQTLFPGPAALLPVLGATLLIHAGESHETKVSRILALQPLVFVGLISYSLYLWHWPILVFLRLVYAGTELPFGISLLGVFGALIIASLSYKFIEQPFRRKNLVPLRRLMQAGAASLIAALGVSALAMGTEGFAARLEPSHRLIAAAMDDTDPRRAFCSGRQPASGLCLLGHATASPSFLLWGDSHAEALMPAVDQSAAEAGAGGFFAGAGSCPPLLGVTIFEGRKNRRCPSFNEEVMKAIESKPDLSTVILAARWAGYVEQRPPGEPGARWVLSVGRRSDSGDQDNFDVFAEGLDKTVGRLKAAGKSVILLNSTPEITWNVPRALFYRIHFGMAVPEPPTLDDVRRRNGRVDQVFLKLARRRDVSIIDLPGHLCRPRCLVEHEGRPVYHDDDHISRFGATRVIATFLKAQIWETAASAVQDTAKSSIRIDGTGQIGNSPGKVPRDPF
jgi:peptidoglycan/LPS O-acetylase OafA/YrhL